MEVNGFKNYEIHENGNVFNKNRKTLLKSYQDRDGYERLKLCQNGISKNFAVHRLVAMHYLDNPNNYNEVDHINRIKDDNRLENLRWANRSMNSSNRDKYIRGSESFFIQYINPHIFTQ
jgi:hypothetical protein